MDETCENYFPKNKEKNQNKQNGNAIQHAIISVLEKVTNK